MEDKLKLLFANVNDWLKFAETKNGIITTLDGAAILGLLTVLCDDNKGIAPYKGWLYCLLFSLIISLLTALSSFIPNMRLFKTCKKPDFVKDNLMYYGDICKYTPKLYLERLHQRYENKTIKYENCFAFEKDITEQIVINSTLCKQKCNFFLVSIFILIIPGLLTLIGCLFTA